VVVPVLVVVTRLSPRGLAGLRAAMALSGTVVAQLEALPGFRGGRLLVDVRRDLWTLTTWADRASLAAFGALHAPVVGRIDEVAVASATSAWQQTATDVPGWAEVRSRWTDGRGPGRGLSRPLPPGPALVEV
jgi:hypothetical protein